MGTVSSISSKMELFKLKHFQVAIIDEASQVSIAQAFPALLRAKKVLILGDNKQFSNVKANQARSDTNKEYLNNLFGYSEFRKGQELIIQSILEKNDTMGNVSHWI